MSRGKKSQKKKNRHYNPSTPKRWDIFNGNVTNPGEFVLVYAMIGIICIATLISFAIWSAPRSAEDLQYSSVRFCQVEVQDDLLLLYTDESDQYYSVPAYKDTLTDPDGFLELCKNGTTFHIGYIDYPKAEVPHFGLESIVDSNGAVYLTIYDIYNYRWHDAPYCFAIFGGLTVVWFIFCGLSIYVGRNPDRFSRRTIRLFFKDGYVHRKNP